MSKGNFASRFLVRARQKLTVLLELQVYPTQRTCKILTNPRQRQQYCCQIFHPYAVDPPSYDKFIIIQSIWHLTTDKRLHKLTQKKKKMRNTTNRRENKKEKQSKEIKKRRTEFWILKQIRRIIRGILYYNDEMTIQQSCKASSRLTCQWDGFRKVVFFCLQN